MKILITGGCGFIGRHLVQALLLAEARHDVTALDLRPRRIAGLPEYKVIQADITDPGLGRSLPGFDVVFHLAAVASVRAAELDPARAFAVNVAGTVNVLEQICMRRFVYAGTAHPPCNVYGLSKHQVLPILKLLHASSIDCLPVALANVYGPGQPRGSVLDVFERAHRAGQPLPVTGDGTQVRDFVHVADVVERLIELASTISPESIAEIGTSVGTSLNRLASLFGGPIQFVPPVRPEPQRVVVQRGTCPDRLAAYVRSLLSLPPRPLAPSPAP